MNSFSNLKVLKLREIFVGGFGNNEKLSNTNILQTIQWNKLQNIEYLSFGEFLNDEQVLIISGFCKNLKKISFKSKFLTD